MRAPAALVAFGVMAVCGCAPVPAACPAIGWVNGVSLTVDSSIAASITIVQLRVCQNGRCVSSRLQLQPGQQTQSSCGETVCSATPAPDGTKVGFLEAPWLQVGAVSVSGQATRANRSRRLPSVSAQAVAAHPWGPHCGSPVSAHVLVGATGLRVG